MPLPCPILDQYVTKKNVPKTTAKKVYKLTDKELELIRSTNKCHGHWGTLMTLYSRASVVRLACEKYGCTKKNIAEVLAQDSPPIVKQLVERGGGRKKPESTKTKALVARFSTRTVSDLDSDSDDMADLVGGRKKPGSNKKKSPVARFTTRTASDLDSDSDDMVDLVGGRKKPGSNKKSPAARASTSTVEDSDSDELIDLGAGRNSRKTNNESGMKSAAPASSSIVIDSDSD